MSRSELVDLLLAALSSAAGEKFPPETTEEIDAVHSIKIELNKILDAYDSRK